MTLLLVIAVFLCASCAYFLHEMHNAPLGIELGGKFFVCKTRVQSTPYASAAAGVLGGGNIVRS